MPSNAQKLFAPVQLPITTPAVIYTCGGTGGANPNFRTVLETFTAKNNTAVPVTYTLYLVPSGGAPGVTNQMVGPKGLSAVGLYGDTDNPPAMIRKVMQNGDTIQGVASAAASVTVFASGTEIS